MITKILNATGYAISEVFKIAFELIQIAALLISMIYFLTEPIRALFWFLVKPNKHI